MARAETQAGFDFTATPSSSVAAAPQPRPAVHAPVADPIALLPSRPRAWDRLLAAAGPLPVRLDVSAMWTGVVVEVLSEGATARRFLDRDGIIQDVAPDPGCAGRTVFLTTAQARALLAQTPLAVVGGGTHCLALEFSPTCDAAAIEYRLALIDDARRAAKLMGRI